MILHRRTIGLDDARPPEGLRIYAIGDIHGCDAQLEAMHLAIAEDLERDAPPDWRIVHLGDYVDRGPDSAGVLARLARVVATTTRVLALRGNHDQAIIDFLGEPDEGGLFARYGGETTLASYRIEADLTTRAGAVAARDALAAAMPEAHRVFLETLPLSVSFGDFFFCHAGVRPGIAFDRQAPEDLMWIRAEFLGHTRPMEQVVVHGHTPVRAVDPRRNRVNVDTGAVFGGPLSALVLEGNQKRVMEIGGESLSGSTR